MQVCTEDKHLVPLGACLRVRSHLVGGYSLEGVHTIQQRASAAVMAGDFDTLEMVLHEARLIGHM
jgi:hypothetical protein